MSMKNLKQSIDFNSDVSISVPLHKPVGIVFSGGADSTLVLYKIISQTSNPVFLYTIAVKDRGLSHAKVALSIVDWFSERFQNDIQLNVNIKNTTQQGIQSLFVEPSKALRTGYVSSIFTGITANPPHDEHQHFHHYSGAVEPRQRNPEIVRKISPGMNWFTPYTNNNKRDIVTEYDKLGLMDTLFPLTRSCTGGENFSHCGDCWFCEERAWAQK